jgi:transcriptional regulator, ArsR family
METVLWQALAGTRGGPNRARILRLLEERPRNANQLAEELDLAYNTVRHHLDVLERTGSSRAATPTTGRLPAERPGESALGDRRGDRLADGGLR